MSDEQKIKRTKVVVEDGSPVQPGAEVTIDGAGPGVDGTYTVKEAPEAPVSRETESSQAVPVANTAPAPVQVDPTAGLQHSDAGNGLTMATYPGQAPYTGRIPPRQAHWPANYISRSQMTPDQLRADDAKAAAVGAGIKAESAAFDRGERPDTPSWQKAHQSGAVTRGR